MQQAIAFREESQALHDLITPLHAARYEDRTLFKQWSINQILRHLHMWNWAADLSLHDEQATMCFLAEALPAIQKEGFNAFEKNWCEDLAGPPLLAAWQQLFMSMSERFEQADPKSRVKWAGPDMSVRSSITARLMETWAHGQAVYDLLGIHRKDTDRIRNIAVLGINTFGWTFKNRGLPVPATVPYIELLAPSGITWTWGDSAHVNSIRGSATAFCQTVTQTRNVADTDLVTTGPIAQQWMSIAQCFAGPPESPPAAGSRTQHTGE